MALVERRRLLQHLEQPLASVARALGVRGRLLVLERDAEAVGQPLDRAREVDALRLLDERDQVAALPAAEAVEELVRGVDREARRPLLVERAAPGPAGARLAELRSRADDLDHVGRRLHLLDGRLLDYRHASAKRSVMPAT